MINKSLGIVVTVLLIGFFNCMAQKRNNIWWFGHFAAINFGSGLAIVDSSKVLSRGSCVSIGDANGNHLFTVANDTDALYAVTIRGGKVYDKNYNIMQNGDTLVGRAWYQEHVIVPNPADSNLYYIFSAGVTSIYGLYYSVVDLSLNGGLGAVTQKNVMLDSVPADDCVIAIKNGNGRDWWVLFKRSSFPFANPPNNEWHEYIVTPTGVIYYGMQQIGVPFLGNLGKLCVNSNGDKITFTHYDGLVETYDFDRCSGVISNARTIEYPNWPTFLYPCNDCAFSPNGNNLYVTLSDTFSALIQYNLLDTNPALTKDTLWYYNFPVNGIGAVRRAPDNKLYVSSAYYNGFTWNYPYPDSMYNVYNMNLSVINQPDSPGAACDFQPYSFYLGGKRTYWGLPNNPDYDLGRDSGSVCDTIQWAGINEQEATGKGQLFLTYVSAWDKLFINAQHLKGTTYMLTVTDMMGRVVYGTSGGGRVTGGGYFTMDLDCSRFAQGMYIVTVTTYKEQLSKKFVKE